jgi:hypothetical protein
MVFVCFHCTSRTPFPKCIAVCAFRRPYRLPEEL